MEKRRNGGKNKNEETIATSYTTEHTYGNRSTYIFIRRMNLGLLKKLKRKQMLS